MNVAAQRYKNGRRKLHPCISGIHAIPGNNRMHMVSTYHLSSGNQTQDYWYAYDRENRFTVTEGINNSGVVTITSNNGNNQTQGFSITYDAAGNRAGESYYNSVK